MLKFVKEKKTAYPHKKIGQTLAYIENVIYLCIVIRKDMSNTLNKTMLW